MDELEGNKLRIVDYKSALERKNMRAVLGGLAHAGGEMRFSELWRSTGMSKSTLDYNLTVLARNEIITREGGIIKLRYKTPLCYIFDCPETPCAYLGLLGERSGRTESETETAIKLLREKGFSLEKVKVFTTPTCTAEWKDITHLNVEWRLLGDEEISRVNEVEERVKPDLVELIKNYRVIMDCTSATKPATIAYYRLATQFKVPLIYVYEKRIELVWIISKEDLEKELLG